MASEVEITDTEIDELVAAGDYCVNVTNCSFIAFTSR